MTPAARATLDRVILRPAWVVCALVVVPFALGLSVPPLLLYAPFAVSILLLGLPHGAVDHLAVLRARAVDEGDREAATTAGLFDLLRGPAAAALRRVGIVYAVLGGAYLVAWLVAPVASFVFFVLLTWFHWGQGDVFVLVDLADGETHLRTRAQRALALVVRGGLPMLVPLLGRPEGYRAVAERVIALFAPGAASRLDPLFAPGTRLALGVTFAAVSVLALGVGLARARETGAMESWRTDALETALLWGYFLVVPPVLAVGLYFCVWHSLRHIARLVALDPPAARALELGDLATPARRFLRDAAPMTAGALLVFAGLFALVPSSAGGSLEGVVAVYLVLLAVLTLPHVVIVTRMDQVQGIW